jgi:hypothetical protein
MQEGQMSRDGYLPPGCTERDVDMSAPDYWEEREMNDNNQEISTEAFMLRMQLQHEYEEWRNTRRRTLCSIADELMEEDRTWFKWQLAVWHEQTK